MSLAREAVLQVACYAAGVVLVGVVLAAPWIIGGHK